MKLYATPYSTFSRRVRIALLEKGLEAELVETGPEDRATPAYRALNPYGRIPTLVDGDAVVYESSAVLEYLEARHPEPALVPGDALGRARTVMHVKLCDLEFASHAVVIQRPKRMQPPERWDLAAMEAVRPRIATHYAILSAELADRPFLVADRFTWADLAYVPFLHFHELLDVPLPENVAAWWGRLAERESVAATIPSM